jgi:hypothetical protein
MASWQQNQAEGRRVLPHPTHTIIAPRVPILQFHSSQRMVICYSDQKQRLYDRDRFLAFTDTGFAFEIWRSYSSADEDFSLLEYDVMNIVI